jgi:hypothetical protein
MSARRRFERGLASRKMPEPEPEYLLKQARRCRSAASTTLDARTRQTLIGMADEYEQKARAIKPAEKP